MQVLCRENLDGTRCGYVFRSLMRLLFRTDSGQPIELSVRYNQPLTCEMLRDIVSRGFRQTSDGSKCVFLSPIMGRQNEILENICTHSRLSTIVAVI